MKTLHYINLMVIVSMDIQVLLTGAPVSLALAVAFQLQLLFHLFASDFHLHPAREIDLISKEISYLAFLNAHKKKIKQNNQAQGSRFVFRSFA